MKRFIIMAIMACSAVALAFSIFYMVRIFQSDIGVTVAGLSAEQEHSERVVIISQEQGSYMMDEIQKGAHESAEAHRLMVDFSGVYRSNLEEFMKQIDIAIASKVDGIIVEGVDDPEFERLVTKATAKGIPVITINSDAPGSLRKTYVGSDHYQEGIVMGEHIASRLNGTGVVGVIQNTAISDADELRLKALKEIFRRYAGLQLVFASEVGDSAQPTMQVYDILNHYPDVSAFIGLPTASGESIVQAVYSRSRINEYQIYMFDDSPQTLALIGKGMIQAGLSRYYEQMGRMSVDLLSRWMEGSQLPLNNSYFTPIRVVTSTSGEGGVP
ncbi:substrate-binding domain-containing protein [Paenibacillus hexagrammi]|uniref:Substrate-binding domain-containing protein n=1 Tax=Paenibacillus hexagrammi TaxID=2908839 RepID=A0ABY3SPY7_9BACL|nr:substrate-binding domain-containing protein [Paenibacillus sp. YPD9-1]UJF36063.1 substrate-binding domain-containing protein [Paenibacillus sp. YPD9-1]